ncbi:MAG: glycosyltransferase, partial [Fusobacteriaceae bacterium]
TTLDIRKKNKLALQKELGLDVHSDVPIIAVLSKLDDERGINILKQGFTELLMRDVQIVIIGGGDEKYEDYFDYYSTVMPNRVYTQAFDFNGDQLSRRIFSGADFLLVISESEPCGIIGMLGLKYGVVPIARDSPGLMEIINSENGFIFKNCDSIEMLEAIDRGLKIYNDSPEDFSKMIIKGMRARNSPKISAKKYIELFKKIKRG